MQRSDLLGRILKEIRLAITGPVKVCHDSLACFFHGGDVSKRKRSIVLAGSRILCAGFHGLGHRLAVRAQGHDKDRWPKDEEKSLNAKVGLSRTLYTLPIDHPANDKQNRRDR